MSFRTDINGLRGLAVLVVVLYHLGVPGFHGGYVGVDVFFVISGYLMTQVVRGKIAKGTFSTLDFYAARARRLVPALLALNVVVLAAGFLLLLPLAYEALCKSIIASLTFVSNIAFWQERGYFDAPSQTKWLLHTWSLSVEWQFYLLYPLFVRALTRLKGGRHLHAGLVLALIASLVLSIGATPLKPEASFFLLPTRAWEMLVGGLISLREQSWPRRRPWLAHGGIAIIIAATLGFDESLRYPGAFALVPVLGAALVIAGRGDSVVLDNRAAQLLGETSYSLYLWHWPLIVASRVCFPELAMKPLLLVGVACASFGAALLSHRLIETPFRSRGASLSGPRYLTRSAAAAMVVAATAVVVVASHGVPARVPPLVAQNDAMSAEFNWDEVCDEHDISCAVGPEQPRKVLFWGDSHAEHLYPAVADLVTTGATHGMQPIFYARKACIPVRGFSDPLAEQSCPELNDGALARASADDVDAVVLASIWTPYFRERLYDPTSRPTLCRVEDRGCTKFPSIDVALSAVRAQLLEDVGALTSRGKRVFLVAPVPMFDRDIAAYMADHAWSAKPCDLVLTRQQHDELVAPVTAMLHDIARATGAVVLNPAEVLCPNNACIYQSDGVTMYRDDNHLSVAGAKLLAGELKIPFATASSAR